MNTLILRFPRQFGSLQLSMLMLIALLQRAPVLRLLVNADSLWLRVSPGHVLRAGAVLASALGLVDTLAGATTFTTNPASPASATVGTPFAGAFALTGATGATGSYTISGLPPGLTVSGALLSGSELVLNNSSGTISGTPTTAGSFVVSITAWQFAGGTGDSIPNSYIINVTGGPSATAPSISSHPSSQSVTAGQAVSFSVTASGTDPLSYQWRKDGNNIGGATASTYSISSTSTGDAGTYSVVVTNAAGSATSNNATLTVTAAVAAPSISSHPSSQSVTVGQPAPFSVSAGGTAPLSYQWRKNGNNIGGATGSSYSIASTVEGDAGAYSVVVTNSAGSATSNDATLTITAAATAPSISTHPSNQSVTAGQAASFSVTASGTAPLSYQWRKNGNNIGGATSSTYSIGSTVEGDAGTYSVVVSNSAGSATSNGAALVVTLLNVAPTITGHPSPLNLAVGESATLVVTASGTAPLSYQWKKNGSNITGATGSTYTIPNLKKTDAGSYTVVVTNGAGSTTSNEALLSVSGSVASDFNGDGKTDWLWQNMATGERSFWFLDGTAVAGGSSLGIVPVEWQISATADFNADGQSDLLWSNSVSGERVIWLMQNGGILSSVSLGVLTVDWQIAACADVSGDGSPDIIWQHTVTGNRVVWTLSGTTVTGGGFIGNLSTEWSIVCAADLSQDGQADLVMQNIATGQRAVWIMNGMTVIDSVSLGTVSLDWSICGAGDLNADGKDDLYLQNALTGERTVWYMNGTTKSSEQVVTTLGTDWALFIPPLIRRTYADFDANGKTDLVWQNSTTKAVKLWLLDGTTLSSELSLFTPGTNERLAGSGDFDGNSETDLVIHNQATGELTIRFYDGVTFLQATSAGTRPLAWQIACTGDFNRDGRADLVWQNTSTGAREIWLMNGATHVSTADLSTVALDWQIAASGDFDSDGRSDLVWQNTVSGERLIWFMSGTVVRAAQTIATVPLGWKIVGTGDFNGDTKTDLIWQNSDSGDRLVWIMVGTLVGGGLSLGNQPLVWDIRN